MVMERIRNPSDISMLLGDTISCFTLKYIPIVKTYRRSGIHEGELQSWILKNKSLIRKRIITNAIVIPAFP